MTNKIYSHAPTEDAVLEKVRQAIPCYISGKRLEHTLSVEKEALKLAQMLFSELGIDKKYYTDISCACLLHDITKYFSFEQQLSLCKKYGISTEYASKDNFSVLHSRTAAFESRRLFGINDIVFGAIYCHTTGKADMNIFEKIVFTADYIEETRTHKSCIEAREYFYSNAKSGHILTALDMTIIMSLDATVSYIGKANGIIDIETIKARDFLLAEYTLQRSVQE